MKCINPITLKHMVNGKWYNDYKRWITVPCGQCFACRVNRTSMWTFRLMLELTDWSEACFVTLTYDDENLPCGNGLDYDDLQKFIKRLRKNYGKPIKYYACGEYGDNDRQVWYGNYTDDGRFLGRPHFHLIVYGIPCTVDARLLISRCWTFCDPERFLYNSKGVAPVSINDIAYVAGYCQKKLTGELGRKIYDDQGIAPPQSRSSRGLGLNAFQRNIEQVRTYGCVFWNGSKMPIPRYFREKLQLDIKRDDETIQKEAKIIFGDRFTPNDLDFYKNLDRIGLLKSMFEDMFLSQNEQRKLDHLYCMRQKASLHAAWSYHNKSYE